MNTLIAKGNIDEIGSSTTTFGKGADENVCMVSYIKVGGVTHRNVGMKEYMHDRLDINLDVELALVTAGKNRFLLAKAQLPDNEIITERDSLQESLTKLHRATVILPIVMGGVLSLISQSPTAGVVLGAFCFTLFAFMGITPRKIIKCIDSVTLSGELESQ